MPTTGGTETEGSETDTEDPSAGFISDVTDSGGCAERDFSLVECSVWDQDCCPGEKCNPWANDGGEAWNATRCVVVDPEAGSPGDPCTVEGSDVSGVDSCVESSMCWNVDPATNEGECVAFCEGDEFDPECPEGTECLIGNDGVLIVCLPTCDPLDALACDEGFGCHPGHETTWHCLPDGAHVFVGSLRPALCDAGTTAVEPIHLDSCDAEPCCAAICDVNAPVCDGGTQCVAFADGSDIGLCVDPL